MASDLLDHFEWHFAQAFFPMERAIWIQACLFMGALGNAGRSQRD
jgi:hypothetical protein